MYIHVICKIVIYVQVTCTHTYMYAHTLSMYNCMMYEEHTYVCKLHIILCCVHVYHIAFFCVSLAGKFLFLENTPRK